MIFAIDIYYDMFKMMSVALVFHSQGHIREFKYIMVYGWQFFEIYFINVIVHQEITVLKTVAG